MVAIVPLLRAQAEALRGKGRNPKVKFQMPNQVQSLKSQAENSSAGLGSPLWPWFFDHWFELWPLDFELRVTRYLL
jgi:hypothetical protein